MRNVALNLALFLSFPGVLVAQSVQTGAAQQVACDSFSYSTALQFAVLKAVGDQNNVVTVVVRPAFWEPYALSLKHMAEGTVVIRTRPHRSLRVKPQLGDTRTAYECITETMEAMGSVVLPISSATAQRFWSEFGRIDLHSNSCPRHQTGECAYVLDGANYLVQSPERKFVTLTAGVGAHGIRSENPALLDWVDSLVKAARETSLPTSGNVGSPLIKTDAVAID